MMLVLDANILFSALIKDGVTAELLFDSELVIFTPEFILSEFMKYENVLLKKTSRTREQFSEVLNMIKEIVTVIPEERYLEFMKEAKSFSPDEKDIAYLALALKLNCAVWSNDRVLKNQDRVQIYSTSEVMKFIL